MTTYPNHEQQRLQNNSCTYIVRAVGTGWAQGHVPIQYFGQLVLTSAHPIFWDASTSTHPIFLFIPSPS